MVRVYQVMKDIERCEELRKSLRLKIADRFNDDQVVEAKKLIINLDEVTKVLGNLYNLEVDISDEDYVITDID